jgi:predicted  nucleic acid-binding Zn-ribbon protein
MDQQIQLLWEYQQIDLQVANIEKKLRASPTRKKLMQARDYLVDSQNLMKKMEADAGELRISYDSTKQKYDTASVDLESLAGYIAECDRDTTMQELERMRKEAADIQASLGKQERELQSIIERVGKIESNVNKITANVPKAKRDFTQYKEVYDKEAAQIAAETAPYKQKLQALEAKLDPKKLQRYMNIKKTRINPLAPVRNSRCSGCNMELPSVALKKVVEGGALLECENCGRLLFIE